MNQPSPSSISFKVLNSFSIYFTLIFVTIDSTTLKKPPGSASRVPITLLFSPSRLLIIVNQM